MRRWALWGLPALPRAYVAVVPTIAAVGALALASTTVFQRGDLLLFVVLAGGGAASVEATRRLGEPSGVAARDLLSAWWLPAAVLLPPVYALVLPLPLMALTQWRVRRAATYRRVFSAAAIGLAYGGSSLVLHRIVGGAPADAAQAAHPATWLLLTLACGAGAVAVNAALVGAGVRTADPQVRWRDIWGLDSLRTDAVELCIGAAVTALVLHSTWYVAVVLPPLLLLQRGLLHDQLSAAARTDAKTGLLNAVTWEREAASGIDREARAGRSAAVLLVDIDHFKRVNDTFGHLVGDDVLRAVAQALGGGLRGVDLLGRFGGEEFVVFLPGADTVAARRTAERLRCGVAGLVVSTGAQTDAGAGVRVTVSVGVAATDVLCRVGVTELLAAADACLYRAKTAGRDRVDVLAAPRHG